MAIQLTKGQQQFQRRLAEKTGLNSRVIAAWMLAEESGAAAQSREKQGNNNWLNIAYFDSGPGAVTKSRVWSDPISAADATADFLKGRRFGAAPGIRRILSTAGQGPQAQIQAIASSGWASSGYNGGASLRNLLKQAPAASGTATPAASTVPKPTSTTRTVTTPGVDRSAQRKQLLAQYLLNDHDPNALLNLASGLGQEQDTPPTTTQVKVPQPSPQQHQPSTPGHPGTVQDVLKLTGTVTFDGKPVAAWVGHVLSYARKHGWQGTLSSGYRSDAEQTRIYKSGVRPAAVPKSMGGAGSNHEGTRYPLGAADVTQAQQLSQILKRSPYASILQYAGAKDPVHFSHQRNGSY